MPEIHWIMLADVFRPYGARLNFLVCAFSKVPCEELGIPGTISILSLLWGGQSWPIVAAPHLNWDTSESGGSQFGLYGGGSFSLGLGFGLQAFDLRYRFVRAADHL